MIENNNNNNNKGVSKQLMFAVAGGLAIVGILINKKLMAYLEKRRKKHPHKTKVSK